MEIPMACHPQEVSQWEYFVEKRTTVLIIVLTTQLSLVYGCKTNNDKTEIDFLVEKE